jgi:CheY-like chemotaxis protein
LAENRTELAAPFRDHSGVATVLIVDDNDRFRARARSWLESDGFSVVAEAADGASALAAVRAAAPEVVLLDVHLPDISGIALAEQITRSRDAPAVVLTSTRDAADFGDSLAASGAAGFVPKADLSGAALSRLLD